MAMLSLMSGYLLAVAAGAAIWASQTCTNKVMLTSVWFTDYFMNAMGCDGSLRLMSGCLPAVEAVVIYGHRISAHFRVTVCFADFSLILCKKAIEPDVWQFYLLSAN